MGELKKLLECLQLEYNSIKDDKQKLQEFNMKKEKYLQTLRDQSNNVTNAIEEITNLIKPEKTKIENQPLKIEQTLSNDDLGKLISIGNYISETHYVKFLIHPPERWLYKYHIEKLTKPNDGKCLYQINLLNIPKEHFKIDAGNKYGFIHLYLCDINSKKIVVKFNVQNETEIGIIV